MHQASDTKKTVTQVMKLGNQLVSVGGGVRYWADSTDGGPEGFGVRLRSSLRFILPVKQDVRRLD